MSFRKWTKILPVGLLIHEMSKLAGRDCVSIHKPNPHYGGDTFIEIKCDMQKIFEGQYLLTGKRYKLKSELEKLEKRAEEIKEVLNG